MKQFKIRCSAIGSIMKNDRSGKEMGETAKTWLKQWYKEQLYNRRKEFYSKYTDKGITVEQSSIEYVCEQMKLGFALKNEDYFENDFMCGTPDVILPKPILEIKNSWDCFTFPLLETEPNSDHWWQVQGYMNLTGKEVAHIIYVLMDMPEHLIQRQVYLEAQKLQLIELEPEVEAEIREQYLYSKLASNLRLKSFEIQRDNEAIKSIENRVIQCRTYLQTLKF